MHRRRFLSALGMGAAGLLVPEYLLDPVPEMPFAAGRYEVVGIRTMFAYRSPYGDYVVVLNDPSAGIE